MLHSALESVEQGGRITPHVFRRSVATVVDAEATLEPEAAVLGHAGTVVTSAHYVAKTATAPDVSSILEDTSGEDRDENGG